MAARLVQSAGKAGVVRRPEHLFATPLPLPTDTAYEKIGVGPDVTDDDIRLALAAARRRLEAEKRHTESELQPAYGKFPELKKAYDDVEQAQRSKGDGPNEALGRAQRTIAELERKALAVQPRLVDLRKQAAALDERILDLNRLSLEKPDERQKYDEAHPPLALVKLSPCTTDEPILDRREVLALLRMEISRFLEARGERVFHPTDLTRMDFSSDFARTPLLDGE